MKPVAWQMLTDDDRIEILNSMPDYMDGFCKTWGWLNFSKATEEKIIEKNSHLISHPAKELTDEDCIIPIWLAKNFLESTDVPRFKRILEEAILRKAQEK